MVQNKLASQVVVGESIQMHGLQQQVIAVKDLGAQGVSFKCRTFREETTKKFLRLVEFGRCELHYKFGAAVKTIDRDPVRTSVVPSSSHWQDCWE